jgi:hypothetical protein
LAVFELFLRFWRFEIILWCFQTGRKSQWARAHFFVGGDNFGGAAASGASGKFAGCS